MVAFSETLLPVLFELVIIQTESYPNKQSAYAKTTGTCKEPVPSASPETTFQTVF